MPQGPDLHERAGLYFAGIGGLRRAKRPSCAAHGADGLHRRGRLPPTESPARVWGVADTRCTGADHSGTSGARAATQGRHAA